MTIASKTVAKAVREVMPHIDAAVWDLEPFMPGFHNWRKNMVFVECEKGAVEELAERLARKFGKAVAFYTGVIKPHPRNFGAAATEASIIVLARDSFSDTVEDKALGAYVPTLEERSADLLSFSLRKSLPIDTGEAAGAIAHMIRTKKVSVTKLHRFATRKYAGWFLNIALYVLAEKKEITGIDPRHLEAGRDAIAAIKRVEELE